MMKIAILGSTGSIGTQTLDIVREQGDIQVTAIAAGSNIKKLEEQMREFHPLLVCVFQEDAAKELRDRTKDLNIRVVSGMDGLLEVAVQPESEILVTAIVGMLGIRPTIAAIEAGKKIALANKETLVTAGHIIMPLAKKCGVPILPVDSEHSAIFQSLQGEREPHCEDSSHGVRRTVPREKAGRSGIHSGGGCAASSELDNGTQDHDRFVNACQ